MQRSVNTNCTPGICINKKFQTYMSKSTDTSVSDPFQRLGFHEYRRHTEKKLMAKI